MKWEKLDYRVFNELFAHRNEPEHLFPVSILPQLPLAAAPPPREEIRVKCANNGFDEDGACRAKLAAREICELSEHPWVRWIRPSKAEF